MCESSTHWKSTTYKKRSKKNKEHDNIHGLEDPKLLK